MSGTELEMKAGLAGSSPAQVAFAACRQLTSRHLSLQNYPDGPDKVAGFVDYHLIELLQWDHIYTAPYFLALLALLGASLAACTSTRQWPMVRVARRYGAEGAYSFAGAASMSALR